MQDSESKITDILLFTQDMMMIVIEDQWDRLMEMQVEQDIMIKQLFSLKDIIFSEKELEELEEVQRLNQEILKATEMQRNDTAKRLTTMKQGKTKAQAYQSL